MGVAFTAYPPVVKVASAVGCGDAFLAGLLFELSAGELQVEEIIRSATAVASASAEHPQPGFFEPRRAAALRTSVEIL
jgi:tagatose 6-phosphate kinase